MSSSGGVNQQIEKENVGVMLKMTPHINDNNQITLSLEPEVSNISGWKGADGDIPVIRTRKTSTTVRVENGQTVILAGLLSEEKNESIRKIPILGDIPVLGLLFQHKREEIRKTNLIIEVVPRIIHDPAEIAKYMSMHTGESPRRGKGKGKRSEGQRQHSARLDAAVQPAPAPAVQPVAAPAPVHVPAQPEPVAQPAAPQPTAQPEPAAAQPAPMPVITTQPAGE
jgi:type II secretory pathway component GspD/PulD (secretin)